MCFFSYHFDSNIGIKKEFLVQFAIFYNFLTLLTICVRRLKIYQVLNTIIFMLYFLKITCKLPSG